MAGHSKWAKVKHFKGAIDAKRGKIFAKLSREITVAAKLGGGDPDLNPHLRMVLLNRWTITMTCSRCISMPNFLRAGTEFKPLHLMSAHPR